jgi:predicted ATP-grasp superfamily ATP-dependent carboligase
MGTIQKVGHSLFADVSTPVVVLASNHHGSLGIARSLGRLGIAVYCIDVHPQSPPINSRYFRREFSSDIDLNKSEETIFRLVEVSKKIGKRPILLATSDESAVFLSDHSEILSEYYIFPRIPSYLPRALTSKKEMFHLAKENGIPTPNAHFPQNRNDILEFLAEAEFPVMLKTIYGHPSQSIFKGKNLVVKTKAELFRLFDRCEDPSNIMLQEYIPGFDESTWMFNGYFDERGECLFEMTGKKLRQSPPHSGITTLGMCVRNDDVANMTKDFMRKIGYRGILDIGYRYDERDSKYKVLDINPRIGCTFRLFVADNGLDVARAEYLDLTCQLIPHSRIIEGRKWFVEDLDLYSSTRYVFDRSITLKELTKSYRGIQEAAWLSLDDPLPFFMMCMNSSMLLIKHAIQI